MPEATAGEKTLPASGAKRERARSEGNIAKSQDLSAAVTLLMAFFAMRMIGPAMLDGMVDASSYFFSQINGFSAERGTLQLLAFDVVRYMAQILIPFMLLMLFGGFIINAVQVGILFTTKPMQPKFDKLNPITGMQKFFSLRVFAELVKSIFKLTLVAVIVWVSMKGKTETVLELTGKNPMALIGIVAEFVGGVWWRIGLALLVLGLFDYAFQRWQHEKDLMMTVQESRDEMKQFEGDPRIRQRVRQIQRQMAMQRMMGDVPTADVVVTNPTRFAVALRYVADEMAAPIVVAKGTRLVAERIRDLAIENDVPIVQRPELARTLYKTIEPGQPVPEKLFAAVVEVLTFVYMIDRRAEKVRERARITATARQAV